MTDRGVDKATSRAADEAAARTARSSDPLLERIERSDRRIEARSKARKEELASGRRADDASNDDEGHGLVTPDDAGHVRPL